MTPSSALVLGLGVTGRAVTRALARRGASVVAVEDRPTDDHRAFAKEVDVELVEVPDAKTFVPLDQPDAVADAISAFVAGHPTPAPTTGDRR